MHGASLIITKYLATAKNIFEIENKKIWCRGLAQVDTNWNWLFTWDARRDISYLDKCNWISVRGLISFPFANSFTFISTPDQSEIVITSLSFLPFLLITLFYSLPPIKKVHFFVEHGLTDRFVVLGLEIKLQNKYRYQIANTEWTSNNALQLFDATKLNLIFTQLRKTDWPWWTSLAASIAWHKFN